jgi:hypothetical protein
MKPIPLAPYAPERLVEMVVRAFPELTEKLPAAA